MVAKAPGPGTGKYPREGSVWTPDRRALARLMDATNSRGTDILAALNQLPGPPVRSIAAVHAKLNELRGGPRDTSGHRVEPSPRREGLRDGLDEGVWTGARITMMRRMWCRGDSVDLIIAKLNELPGPEIHYAQTLTVGAVAFGLRRPTAPSAASGVVFEDHAVAMAPEEVREWALAKHVPFDPLVHTDSDILRAVNSERAKFDLPPFKLEPRLS